MKTFDLLKIAIGKIGTHRKKSIYLLLSVSIIFILSFCVNYLFLGYKQKYIQYAELATDDEVIILAEYCLEDCGNNLEYVKNDIAKYNGRFINTSLPAGYISLPQELIMKIANDKSNITIHEDETPMLVSTSWAEYKFGISVPVKFRNIEERMTSYINYRNSIIGKHFINDDGKKYVIVGLSPAGYHLSNLSFKELSSSSAGLLDPILEAIQLSSGVTLVANSDSQNDSDSNNASNEIGVGIAIFTFSNKTDALAYLNGGEGKFSNVGLSNKKYAVSTIAGPNPEALYSLDCFEAIVDVICTVLSIMGAIIVILTSLRIIEQEMPTIELYRSVGASKKQIRLIYLVYFATIALCSLFLSLIAAFIIAIIYSVSNQEILEALFITAFSLKETGFVLIAGINHMTVVIAIILLSSAPLCVTINRKRLH